jgi:hypothetical protein
MNPPLAIDEPLVKAGGFMVPERVGVTFDIEATLDSGGEQ